MDILIPIISAFLALLVGTQFVSITLVVLRKLCWRRAASDDRAGVTIIKPVCGLENNLRRTLQSSLSIDYPQYEILFCVASPDDPAITVVRELIATHTIADAGLLIGDDNVSQNPKLNNLWKGWRAAKYDRIVISDSNVLIPPGYIDDLRECWSPVNSFVCSPPVGTETQGPAAALEAAFLNTYQARWQLVADFLGIGYVQGKTMMLSRRELEHSGGLSALGNEIAEDAAATKIARRTGKKVAVVREPFQQPLGHRTYSQVWTRQLRWAQLRRSSFPLAYSAEILSGVLPAVVLYCVLSMMHVISWIGLPVLIACWYSAEVALAAIYRWPLGLTSPLAWILRDLLLPLLWILGWFTRGFVWHGNSMTSLKRSNLKRELSESQT
ncbi:ceramide glucosyltransferase [Neorhizobium sp. LjRoot104]|uniref:ceramide glucosyltransferase n=1 Tax=Neorhizobium sp. LjRoot104 TaxID=3342254 RepID=UPI003ECF3297